MTRYAGLTLADILTRQKQSGVKIFNSSFTRSIMQYVLRGLRYLHSAGVSLCFESLNLLPKSNRLVCLRAHKEKTFRTRASRNMKKSTSKSR